MKSQRGQALVFVIATMTVALAMGVGVSLRNLSSISRTSRTDTAARAQAAAEGGAENILSRSESELEALVLGGVAEVITFIPSGGDNVTAEASVSVSKYSMPSGQNYLSLRISEGQVSEVVLSGDDVDVCWYPVDEDTNTDLYFTAYAEDGEIRRGGVSASDRDGFPGGYEQNFEDSDGGRDVFNDCFKPDLPSDVSGLRIRSINGTSYVGVYPDDGGLPAQGYEITSIGKLKNVEAGEEAEASVVVRRSYSYLPGVFDFGVFSGSSGDALD